MNLLKQPGEVWKMALKVFDKTEKSFGEDVETVREWMKTQHHLPEVMEDIKIQNFLLLNKCSIEKTKRRIDMYYTIRSLLPDFYDEANPKLPHMQEYMDADLTPIHPMLTKDMYRVYFFKLKIPKKGVPKLASIQIFNMTEIRLYEDCMMGEVLVLDMKNYTLEDITKVTPTLLTKVHFIYKNVYSLRVKAIYFVNSLPFLSRVMPMLKLLLKPKVFQRIHVYQDFEILNQLFSKEDLPKDYGGEGPSLHELNEMWRVKFREYQPRFDLLDKLRVKEDLRPQKVDNNESMGFYGSFKKLAVD